ncbi:MAG TPA: FAD-dependent oxidoreductase [Streptosporangiaceae bacterium]
MTVPADLPPNLADLADPAVQGGRAPRLDDAQLDALREYGGTEHLVAAGEVLFADGDEAIDLIVVLDGTMTIVQNRGGRDEQELTSYTSGQFLGEIGLLTGQRPYVSAVADTDGRILRLPPGQLRQVMAQEPSLSEQILRAFLLRHSILTRLGSGLKLIGSRFSPDTRRLLEVLARNRLPYQWVELEASADAEQMLTELRVPVSDLPIIVIPGAPLLRNPTDAQLLTALGIAGAGPSHGTATCDLLVVGGGPGGLAAAVYGASEGMSTILAEDTALGGQAGTSSRIENYLGFPAGLSGEELTARAALQAQKFGARIKLAARAVSLSSDQDVHRVGFDDGETVTARSVIIATGARYNRLPLDRLSEFEGTGVYYAATQMEAQGCGGGPSAIVGGGNSAGQAAIFLSRHCTEVRIVIRAESLASSMSRYLIDQIERNPKITVMPRTEVVALAGDDRLQAVDLRDRDTGEVSPLPVSGLFVFIGAKPCTDWLDGQLATDNRGFVLTGTAIPAGRLAAGSEPLLLDTSRPGVFCVGDIRSGSVKRCATAIGEGSMAVRLVFDRLQAHGTAVARPPRAEA